MAPDMFTVAPLPIRSAAADEITKADELLPMDAPLPRASAPLLMVVVPV